MEMTPDMLFKLNSTLVELDARITVNQFLLQRLYAQTFAPAPHAFETFIADAQASLLTNIKPAEPTTSERIEDLQVRISVHLELFRRATLRRIESM